MKLRTVIQCPHCSFRVTESMPSKGARREYHCEACGRLYPLNTEQHCVFCVYGRDPCPEQQLAAMPDRGDRADH